MVTKLVKHRNRRTEIQASQDGLAFQVSATASNSRQMTPWVRGVLNASGGYDWFAVASGRQLNKSGYIDVYMKELAELGEDLALSLR